MKKRSTLKLLAVSLGLAVAGITQFANAAVISYDPFDTSAGYSTGSLDTQNPAITGYTGAWTGVDFGSQRPGVITGSLDYTDPLYIAETGDKVGVPTNTTGGENRRCLTADGFTDCSTVR